MSGQINTAPNDKIIQKISFDYLEGCETGMGDCNPIKIFRKTKQDSIFLIFPNGGTRSDIYLHSIKNKKIELHDRKSAGEGYPTLNLTSLEDGTYYANMVSCNVGGGFKVKIITKPK